MNDNTSSLSHDRCVDRRTVLSGLSVVLVALAGCSSSPSDTNSPSSGTSTPPEGENNTFASVAMNETDLVVELASDTDVNSVNLINPNGEMNSLQRVQEGATQVTFQLLGESEDGYTPGDYRVVAVADDETIGETTISLQPEVTITEIKWAQNHPDLNWDKDRSTWRQFAALTVENTGNAPTYLTALQWADSPHTKVSPSETLTHNSTTLLPPGETTIYSAAPIYQTEDPTGVHGAIDCGNLETDTLTVTGVVQAGTNPSYSQTIEYGGEKYSCELTIVDGSPAGSTQTSSNGSGT
jgi:hypothetical protein